jgi:hypothetical protein
LLPFSLLFFVWSVAAVPLRDNVLFAFEKCKSLSVDLHRGQLAEAVVPPFDLHCMKKENGDELTCFFFDPGSNKKTAEEVFKGGSDLGHAELKSSKGAIIKFLIGKQFASFVDTVDHKVCAGIYLFEDEARKKKK